MRVSIHLNGQATTAPEGTATITPARFSAAFGRNQVLFAKFPMRQSNGNCHPNQNKKIHCRARFHGAEKEIEMSLHFI
jgi:hypothetical protein